MSNFAAKLHISYHILHIMIIKKIQTSTLIDALKRMNIGETAEIPNEYSKAYVKRICSTLKSEGYVYSTTTKLGPMVVTRLS